MAFSLAEFPGDGVQTDFQIDFLYISKNHIKATVDGVPVDYEWQSDFIVRIEPAPAAGTRVLVYRDSVAGTILVDFTMPSVLAEKNLDTAYLHSKFLAEEAVDRATFSMGLHGDGSWDAQGRRISGVATPVQPEDAVNKAYSDTILDATTAQKDQATAQRVAAEAARDTADVHKTAAQVARTGSEAARDVAVDARDDAVALVDALGLPTSLAGKALAMLRVNATADAYELRDSTQILTDFGLPKASRIKAGTALAMYYFAR